MFGFGLNSHQKFIVKNAEKLAQYNRENCVKLTIDSILLDIRSLAILERFHLPSQQVLVNYLSCAVFAFRSTIDVSEVMNIHGQKAAEALAKAMVENEIRYRAGTESSNLPFHFTTIASVMRYRKSSAQEPLKDQILGYLSLLIECIDENKNLSEVASHFSTTLASIVTSRFPNIISIVEKS